MHFKRLSFVVFSLVFIVSLSGCSPKVWTYDFVEEGSLTRGKKIWRPNTSNFSFTDGLILTGADVGAPHLYQGDFSVTWNFYLNTSPSKMALLEFFLASGESLSGTWLGGFGIPNAGSDTSELAVFYKIPSQGNESFKSIPIAGLISEVGSNSIKLEKIGDVLKFYINGTLIAPSLAIIGTSSTVFCPYFGCFYNSGDECVFKDVIIEYKGDQILID